MTSTPTSEPTFNPQARRHEAEFLSGLAAGSLPTASAATISLSAGGRHLLDTDDVAFALLFQVVYEEGVPSTAPPSPDIADTLEDLFNSESCALWVRCAARYGSTWYVLGRGLGKGVYQSLCRPDIQTTGTNTVNTRAEFVAH